MTKVVEVIQSILLFVLVVCEGLSAVRSIQDILTVVTLWYAHREWKHKEEHIQGQGVFSSSGKSVW